MAQETEKSFPCDAEVTETGYDKEYVAEDFARYFQAFISSGIFMKEDTNLQVIANGDMTVTLKAGKMIIDGYRYDSTGDIIITIDPADGVLGRIDRISATWCKDEGDIHYTLQKGTPSYKPVAPECRRTEEYKDYVVADIYVAAGVIKIQQQNITDQRLNSDVCGLAIPFTELNTNAIFTQYQDAVNEFLKFADTCIDSTVVGQIESDLANKLDKTGDSGDNVVAFTQTASRQNIMTGDTHKTIFGKIKKWLTDLTATAFAQMITTKEDLLATKVTGYVPDAKAVADTYTELNGNLNEIEGKIDNSIKKVNIHHSGTTEVEYTLPQNIGLNDVIICNSSFGGVSGTTFVLGGYALYYSAFSTHVAYTIPAPNSTSSNATSNVTLIAQNKIKVKCNNANAFCSVTVIMGGNSAN